MAKQLVNPLERHVDKAVLGLTALVLIGAVVRFLVTSPNQADFGGEAVTPSNIDRKVFQAARTAQDRLRNAQSSVERVEPLIDEFKSVVDPFKNSGVVSTLPAGVQFGADVPLIDKARADSDAKLVEVPDLNPDPPGVIHGRSMFYVGEGQERRDAINWVTLSARFDVKKQMANQGSEYGAARKKVTFGPLEVQRRAIRKDGTWSDDDWETIANGPAGKVPPIPHIGLAQERDHVFVPGPDLQKLGEFETQLEKPEVQLELIRPLMYSWVPGSGDPWVVSRIAPRVEIEKMDSFYQEIETVRYAEASAEGGQSKVPPEKKLDQAERDMKVAWTNKSKDAMTTVYNTAFTIQENESIPQAVRKRAEQIAHEANLKLGDIKRLIETGRVGNPDSPQGQEEKKPLPIQLLWAHDALKGSIKSGTAYQYRIRPLIYNRLAGEPTKFKDKADAQVIFIPGKWSKPVEVDVPADTHYWITGDDERNDRVNVEMYKWAEGVWTKSERFKLGIGDRVFGESRHDVPPFEPGGEPENVTITYATNDRVMDVDFNRRFRERRRGKGRDGVKFAAARKVCSVVIEDADGRLVERIVAVDKDDPSKRMIEVYKRPKGD